MKLKEIEELIDFIAKSGLEEVHIETEQIKLNIKRNFGSLQQTDFKNIPNTILSPTKSGTGIVNHTKTDSTNIIPSEKTQLNSEEKNYITIKSPMIGTFYRSNNPESPPFVQEGSTISAGKTICIIEAMKLFNEIEAETTGKIIKILVEDASPVEYDQPLFLIQPTQ